ncbi:hypothetical protein JHE06_11110 [Carnobacterium sp. CS13]|nr:hypothetical protein JHE06_11110 [Carnobacterium sp. CS13]
MPAWTCDLVSKQITYYDHPHQALLIKFIPEL